MEGLPGGIPALLDSITTQVGNEFRPLINQVGFKPPAQDDPRKVRPKETDVKFAEKLNAHNAYLLERDVWMELGYIREDFSYLVSILSETYGEAFFSYMMKNVNNRELRGKYAVTTAEGQQLWDCSLYEPFNGPLVLSKLSKELQGTSSKEFKSKFARKAMADLASYEELRAKREAALEEMYSSPTTTSSSRSSWKTCQVLRWKRSRQRQVLLKSRQRPMFPWQSR